MEGTGHRKAVTQGLGRSQASGRLETALHVGLPTYKLSPLREAYCA